jgi:hypothetical protein
MATSLPLKNKQLPLKLIRARLCHGFKFCTTNAPTGAQDQSCQIRRRLDGSATSKLNTVAVTTLLPDVATNHQIIAHQTTIVKKIQKGGKEMAEVSQTEQSSSSGVVFWRSSRDCQAPTFQEDDVVTLRGYEVQILGTRISKGCSETRGCTESSKYTSQTEKSFSLRGLGRRFVGTPATKDCTTTVETAAIGAEEASTPMLPSNTSQSIGTNTRR